MCLITSTVEIFTKNFSYESVFRYLKTGLLDIEVENIDILENFVIETGIKGKRKWTEAELWQEKLEYYFRDYYDHKAATEELQKTVENGESAQPQNSEENQNPATQEALATEKIEATIKILNDTRDTFIIPLIALNEKLKGKNTTRKFCTALFEFLETINVYKTLEGWIENFKNGRCPGAGDRVQ